MMRPSLFAAQEREAKLTKLRDALQLLERHVDFAAMAAAVDQAAPRPSRVRGGHPPFPTEVMVGILLIQQLFNLSDEQMEFQSLDRLSFQRFAGLRDSSQIPDRTTIWTFKERLIKAGASESVFEAVNRQLATHGYIARGGQMIDASIVQAPRQSLSKEEKVTVVEGNAMSADWSPPKRRQKDLDARWTKKHGKSYVGYKLSLNADKRCKLIRKIKISTASEHDTLNRTVQGKSRRGAMRALITTFLLCAMVCQARAEKLDKQIFGHWKIVSVADFAGIGADTDEADAKRLIGAELTIASNRVRFDGEECRNPSYNAERKTLAQAFRIGFQLKNTDKLKLPDPVMEIETNCENPTAISLFYVRGKRQMIFVWSGIFFNAVKKK